MLNPHIEAILCTQSEDELEMPRKEEIGTVFFAEEALAQSMAVYVIERFAPPPKKATSSVD